MLESNILIRVVGTGLVVLLVLYFFTVNDYTLKYKKISKSITIATCAVAVFELLLIVILLWTL